MHGFAVKVVQRDHASHNLKQSRGNFRIFCVSVVHLVANLVGYGLMCGKPLDLGSGAAEDYGAPAGRDLFHLHAMPLQPVHHLRGIGFGDAETLSVLLGCKPLMVVRRLRVELRVEQLVECVLLCAVGQQGEEHALHREIGRDCAGVVSRSGKRMHVAAQRHGLLVIHEGGDAVSHLNHRELRAWGIGRRLRSGGQV